MEEFSVEACMLQTWGWIDQGQDFRKEHWRIQGGGGAGVLVVKLFTQKKPVAKEPVY